MRRTPCAGLSDVTGLARAGKVSHRPDTDSYFGFTTDDGVLTSTTEIFVP